MMTYLCGDASQQAGQSSSRGPCTLSGAPISAGAGGPLPPAPHFWECRGPGRSARRGYLAAPGRRYDGPAAPGSQQERAVAPLRLPAPDLFASSPERRAK